MNEKQKSKFVSAPTPSDLERAEKVEGELPTASGRWGALRRVRPPHKIGLPLGSGSTGDGIER